VKSIFRKLSGALCLAAILLTLPASAAIDMFVDLGPTIPGESRDSTYAGKVDVLAWSWGMSNSGTLSGGVGAGAGTNKFQDLTLTKYVDKASPPLMLACAKGTHLATAKLILRKAGEGQYKYIEITMTDVLVTSVSTGGSGGEDRLTENITLNFGKVQFDYFPMNATGTGTLSAVQFKWDIAQNVAF
jgi:type VI secretion system secreted protein Hcp